MCNACAFHCCAWDGFGGCGCDHCDDPRCWTVEDDDDIADDDFPIDELQGGAAVARLAHNQEVACSTHAPATNAPRASMDEGRAATSASASMTAGAPAAGVENAAGRFLPTCGAVDCQRRRRFFVSAPMDLFRFAGLFPKALRAKPKEPPRPLRAATAAEQPGTEYTYEMMQERFAAIGIEWTARSYDEVMAEYRANLARNGEAP